MKPYHSQHAKKRVHISRCPCCHGKWADKKDRGGKRSVRQSVKQQIAKDLTTTSE